MPIKTRNYDRKRRDYPLNENTRALLRRFNELDWLCRAGEPISEAGVVRPENLREVRRRLFSKAWDNVRVDGSNYVSETLFHRDRARFNDTWNEIVHEAQPLMEPALVRLLTVLVDKLQLQQRASRNLRYFVQRDFMHAFHESEYAGVVAPALFTQLAGWYLAGHLPCGWVGQWPDGQLVVY